MLFDKFENKYILKGTLVALDPIHIGSSSKNTLDPVDVDSAVLKDSRGYPVIPGSSVKGVVRSWFESVLRGAGVFACDVLDNKNCCTAKEEEKRKDCKDLREKAEMAYKDSCEVCRLFGGREFAGKLKFKDSYLIGEPSFEFRDGVGIDRETGAVKKGAKYDFEIISKDSEFSFYLTAENLDEKQKKYFEFIVEALKNGELSVGGKTSRGLGRFAVKDINIEIVTAEDMKKRLGL
ncbi:MAG: CRISPR-associated RAMP protein [Oscillospiraceae bacterium]|nr:CRISPR-associated RAMP protein [Oscillospiraceae bacterium]